jgi:lysophospholipase L1-like esterase
LRPIIALSVFLSLGLFTASAWAADPLPLAGNNGTQAANSSPPAEDDSAQTAEDLSARHLQREPTNLLDDEKALQPPKDKVSPALSEPPVEEVQTAELEDPRDIRMTNPAVQSGLKMRVTGRKIVIGTGQIAANGRTFDLTQANKIEVPPAGTMQVKDEPVKFVDGKKTTDVIVLAKCRATSLDHSILQGILVKGSVAVKNAPGGDLFSKDKDYTVITKLGAVRCVDQGGIKEGDKVFVDYNLWKRRLDTIVFDPDSSQFLLVQGTAARSAPEPPDIAPNLVPLANVYTEWGDKDIPKFNVMPIAETTAPVNARMVEHNRKAMEPITQKLIKGEPCNIVFWGDSVTQGYDARTPDKAFSYAFLKQLQQRFPNCKITSSNLGIGGSCTNDRIDNLKLEVLALKPDLLIVEFVNDFGVASKGLQHNYEVLLDECKAQNVRVILVTPHCPAPKAAKAPTWDSIAERPYLRILHELATTNDFVALADVFARYQHLNKEGLRPELLYVNAVNHPNNRGHQLFTEELIRCFPPADKIASH